MTENDDEKAQKKAEDIRREMLSSLRPTNLNLDRIEMVKRMRTAMELGDEEGFVNVLNKLGYTARQREDFLRQFNDVQRARR